MKTKEEILADEYSKLIQNWEKVYKQNPSIIKAAYTSMEQYSQQQAIAFAEFVFKGCYHVHSYSEEWLWEKREIHFKPIGTLLTTKQIYKEFLSQQKQ